MVYFFWYQNFFGNTDATRRKKTWFYISKKTLKYKSLKQLWWASTQVQISRQNLICIFLISVAPECKKSQRIIYGAAFKSEVMVNCYVEANPMPHSFKWQFKTASKRRRTDLINTVGGAKALDDIKDMVDLPANQYSLEYDHSLLR